MESLLGLLVLLVIIFYKSRKDQASAFPSPPGLPIIGNSLQISSQLQVQFIQWARQFGEVYRVRLGLTDWYILNSPEAVKEILDKQSAVTSSRPPWPILSDALSGGRRFLFMPYGVEWRRLRSVGHKLLTPRMSAKFQPSQELEATQLMHNLLTGNDSGKDFYMHVRRYTVSVLMTSTYGRRIPNWECEDVRGIYQVVKDFSRVSSPSLLNIADGFPRLAKILPVQLQWWQKSLRPMLKRQEILWMRFWTRLRDQMNTGAAPDCFVKQFIEADYQQMGISQMQAAFLAGSLIEAGAESTSSAINSCLLYLSAHPDIQRRAHDEIDGVVGQSRSPSFADASQLPYIRAICKEILRIRPLASMTIPHYTTADVSYKGRTIPKNSIIAMSQYAIHYDPSLFPDPESFKPERYLNHTHGSAVYAAAPDPYDRDHWDFGAGRRICPGIHLAENSMFITIAKTLWAFDLVPPGKVDLSHDAYEPGTVTIPKPFSLKFVCRNNKIENVLRKEWEVIEKAEGLHLATQGADMGNSSKNQ
ncbi:hypothetical protein N7492_010083 [Penicillium capsulatum]|uniref:Cytochrome P450 n=1 Tax=Penicillium capsulatum TaxID=69766 RepID=A0A9W9HKS5_9EURO|nr:hypothetical protein N7492_010083 [Penicillium capsulatum]KAJ6112592.1 hypothetical protein N7512_007916 [Penicillium capsulatum]